MGLEDIDLDSWVKKKEEKPPSDDARGVASGNTSPEEDVASGTASGSTSGTASSGGTARGTASRKKQDRETSFSRSVDIPAPVDKVGQPWILTPRVLAERIAASKLKLAGELAVKGWLLRLGHEGRKGTRNTIRTGELDYLIEIYRQLRREGFE